MKKQELSIKKSYWLMKETGLPMMKSEVSGMSGRPVQSGMSGETRKTGMYGKSGIYVFAVMIWTAAAVMMTACTDTEAQLRQRAAELCRYIPDHELKEQSQEYMTSDFYAVLDTMFNMPEHEAMDHEWLYYFVTGNGGTIADYEVTKAELTDATHAVATIKVRQMWEDGSTADNDEAETEEHMLQREKQDGKWLMSDFDGHKADCIRHIAINRREQAIRDAISKMLVHDIGEHYLKGEVCVLALMIAAEEETGTDTTQVFGEFVIYWYNISGDTLKTVSGGTHAGCVTVATKDGNAEVTAFRQTEDGAGNDKSARRIFGRHYDVYQNIQSNPDVREAIRREQLREYIRDHGMNSRYYKDYGWPAVEL